MELLVSKKTSFDAAHRLPGYKGKCAVTHGHHWVVEVGCSGIVHPTGMVADFSEMKDFLGWIDREFDHRFLNDFLENPTAENITLYIYDEFILWCTARGLRFEYIRLWETETSMVELNNALLPQEG